MHAASSREAHRPDVLQLGLAGGQGDACSNAAAEAASIERTAPIDLGDTGAKSGARVPHRRHPSLEAAAGPGIS